MHGVKQYPIRQNGQRFRSRGDRKRSAPVSSRWRRLLVRPLEDRTLLSGGLPTPFPTPVLGAAPAGGLIYDTSATGAIQSAGDQPSFTLAVDAGQTLTVDVVPSSTLQARIQLFDPNGTRIGGAVAAGAGAEAVLQPVPASLPGTYTLQVTGADGTTGTFRAEMILNAALDTSAHGGASNSTQATAQSLNSATVSLGAGADRLGVLGQFNNADEWYSFHLSAGQSATLGMAVSAGPGGVSPSGTDYAASGPRSVIYADLNGDGIPDMIYANVNTGSVGVRLGLGHGAFGPENDYATDGSPFTLAVGDFNGDGKLDVVTANYNSGDISVLFGNGDGTLQPSPTGAATNYQVSQPIWVTAGDLNHDGYADIVVASPNSNAVAVFLNNKDGTFASPVYYGGANSPNCVAIGDVNGDGVPDLVAVNTSNNPGGSGSVMTWLGKGDGTFGQPVGSNVGNGATGLVLADFNGDGKLDVATADFWNATMSVGLGNGDGTFTPDGTYSTGSGSHPWKIAAGDVTGSGLLDLAVVMPGQSQAAVFLSKGGGAFQQAQFITTESNTTGVALTDVTGDGLADLSVANQDSNTVTVFPSTAALAHLTLYDGHGNELAVAQGATNLNQVVNDFVAPADGTYYARITDVGSATYGLVVTRGAAFATLPNGSARGAQDLNGNTSVLGNLTAAAPEAWYTVSVNAGDTLTVSTATPAGDPQRPYEPENKLDPAVALYDPSGHLVASDDNSGSDGKNAYLTYTALATGVYRVHILSVNKTTGDYVLRVQGATGAPAKFKVTATDPTSGALLTSVSSITVTFSTPVLLKSLADGDLTLDGNPATGFQVVNDHTVIWTLPALPPGEDGVEHSFVISRVKNLQGLRVKAYQGHFFVDNAAPRVVGSSIQEGDVFQPGNLTYTVKFSEPMDASLLNASDFLLHGQYRNADYGPASFAFDVTRTVLTISYTNLPEDYYTETLYSSGFADGVGLHLDGEPLAWPIPPNESGDGVPGGNFYVHFAMDADLNGALPLPTLQPAQPAGSLVADGSASGVIAPPGGSDYWTLSVNPGQTITVNVTPDANLQPTIRLYDPNGTLIGSASASAPGTEALLETVPTTDSAGTGTYTVVVGGGSTGGLYTVGVTLNAALDAESHGGPSNTTIASAQDLTGAFTNLGGGASRAAVLGTTDTTTFLGADASGYEAVAVAPTFVDISGTGTPTLQSTAYQSVDLGPSQLGSFHFAMYGQDYTTICYSDDGLITLGSDQSGTGSTTDLTSFPSVATIAPLWTDINTYWQGGVIYWQVIGSGSNQQLVIQWNNVNYWPNSAPITFEAVLSEATGNIQFNYQNITDPGTWQNNGAVATVGIKDSGTQGGNRLLVSYHNGPNAYLGSNQSTLIGVGVAQAPTPDVYAFHLNKGQSATLAVKGLGLAPVTVQLEDGAGNVLGLGSAGLANVDQAVENFVAPAAGTYYAVVAGSADMPYDLVVTRGADFELGNNNSQAQAQDITATVHNLLTSGTGGALGAVTSSQDADWYSVNTNSGDALTISASVPGSGPGQITNGLNPTLDLYDPSGNLVASTTGGTIKAVANGGLYAVRVYAADGSVGDYVLHVAGATGSLGDFHVTAASIPAGVLIRPPASITIDFNQGIDPASVTDASLTVTVGGVAYNATGFTIDGPTEVTWQLPTNVANGDDVDNQITIAAGALTDVSGTPVDAFTEHYSTDNLPPTVVSSSVAEGQTLAPGDVTETITFSEPLNTTLVTGSAFSLQGQLRGVSYTPWAYSFDPTGTVLTLTYHQLPDDDYTLTVNGSQFQDLVGFTLSPSTYTLDFDVDVDANGPAPFPTPLTAQQPFGSLIYSGSVTNTVNTPGDTDSYTLNVNAAETLTMIVQSAALQPTVTVTDPNGHTVGTAQASAVGQDAVLQTVSATTGGTYTITVGDASGSSGLYTAQLLLNAAVQNALYGGPSDGTTATAQDISGSSVALPNGADRLAVTGGFRGQNDLYAFHLAAGQSVSLAASYGPAATSYLGPYTRYPDLATAVAFGDLTGNGRLDMVTVGGYYNAEATVWLNNGDGTFGAPTVYPFAAHYPGDVKLADVNGDGKLDIVISNGVGNSSTDSVTVMLGNGDGTFGAPIFSSVAANAQYIALGDFNGDGKLDIAQTDIYGGVVDVAYGNGDGTFTFANAYPTTTDGLNGYATQVAVADMNGDGHPDIIVDNSSAGMNGGLAVLMNNGDGTFASPVTYSFGNDNTPGMVVTDLNRDGRPDVALTEYSNGDVAVLLNNGDGTLGPAHFYPAGGPGSYPIGIAAGDVTGDGIPDLVVADSYQGRYGPTGPALALLPGNGDGTFAAAQVFNDQQGGISSIALAVGDLTGNGVADVAVVDNGPVDVFLSQANHVHMQLLDPSGNVVADAVGGATNVDESISNYVAPADGTYYVRMTGIGGGRAYTVVATRGATFDLEPNDTAAQAQDMSNGGGALGTLYQPTAVNIGIALNGLSSDDNSIQVSSPDTQIAIGPAQVVEVTQSAVRIFDKSGNVQATEQLSQLFSGINPNLTYSEPQLVFDDTAQRWYIAADSNDPNGGIDINLAVSNDANALDGFSAQHQFALDARLFNAPYLGFNANAIVLAYVPQPTQGNNTYMALIAIAKNSVLDQNNPTFVTYSYRHDSIGPDSELVPARMYGASPSDPMYLVEENGYQSGTGLIVVTLPNPLTDNPLFINTLVTVNPYDPNGQAVTQPGGATGTIETNIEDVQWRNGKLVAAQSVSEPTDNYTTVHVRWYEFDTTGAVPTLVQQASIAPGPGISTYDGAISINSAGDIGVSYMQSSATQYPSMYVTGRLAEDPADTMAAGVEVQAGTSSLASSPGIYGGVAVDPTDGLTFWGANEYAGSSYWNTGIASFQLSRPADDDEYTFTAAAGQEIRLQVTTPVTGPGQFTDTVDPTLNLYDPNGNLVGTATGVGGTVTYDVALDHGGTYRAELVAANGTSGEYFLSKSLVTLPTATLSGEVFNDLNGDGSLESGEPGLQHWRVDLIDANTGALVQHTLTDANGNYSFSGVILGNYLVHEQRLTGWLRTSEPWEYPITVQPGQSVTGVDFGNFQLVTVSGEVFLDGNDNRQLDAGETGLSGITIDLNGVAVATTDANGNFTITGIGPGPQTITEVTSTYLVTAPVSAAYTFTPTSGQNVSGDNFANVLPAFTEDNGQPGYSQQGQGWQSLARGWNGSSAVHPAGKGASATWQVGGTGVPPGLYEVFVSYAAGAGRSTAAPYTVQAGGSGPVQVLVDQTQPAGSGTYQGVGWQSLGVFAFANGDGRITLAATASGSVDADGLLLVPVHPATMGAAPAPGGAGAAGDTSSAGPAIRRPGSAGEGIALPGSPGQLGGFGADASGPAQGQEPGRGMPAETVPAASGSDTATTDRVALADLLFSQPDQGGTWSADVADFLAREPLDRVTDLLAPR